MTVPTPGPAPDPAFGPAPGPVPDPRRSSVGRVLLAIGVVIGLGMIAWGALYLVDRASTSTRVTHESYTAVERLDLVADGEVTVRADDGATSVEVDVDARAGLAAPAYSARESTGALELTHRCAAWAWYSSTCSGRLHAVVPADTVVTVRTSNGSVRAEGLAEDLELRSSNGSIEATGNTGDVVARTSNGRVEVRESGGDVEARSSNGNVTVDDVDGTVQAETSNGRIEVADVRGSATASTSNGRVEVRGVAGDVDVSTSNGSATVHGTGEPVRLDIDTGNGSQTITGATDPAADRSVTIRTGNGDAAYLGP